MTRTVVLQATTLSKHYTSGMRTLHVVDGVSFALDQGSACAILGPSGSGKSTLLSLCAGLDRPTSGRVELEGQDLSAVDEARLATIRRTRLGFVFQSFLLVPTLTAVENVEVPLQLIGQTNDARERALDLLAHVGLADRASHYPSQLSGGEQQRVALARAFVHKPAILFADEPTGNLDAETASTIVDLLFALNRSAGTTLVLVTHDQDLASRCGRILRLRAGRLVEDTAVPVA